MIFKSRKYIFTFFLVIIIQLLLYANNNQKTSFRYLIWNVSEIEVGKLISISFFSGLIISTILNSSLILKNIEVSREDSQEFDNPLYEEEKEFKAEMPPLRDIRETQPTISVNYRVIKNNEDNDINYREDSYNKKDNEDWIEKDTDW